MTAKTDDPPEADTNTIGGMVEAEVAQEMSAEHHARAALEHVRREVEDYVKVNPWTALFAAAVTGAIIGLLLA